MPGERGTRREILRIAKCAPLRVAEPLAQDFDPNGSSVSDGDESGRRESREKK
jgi:hypothetical protein